MQSWLSFKSSIVLVQESIVNKGNLFEDWVTLEAVDHGEISVRLEWHPVVGADAEADISSLCVVSVVVDGCANLVSIFFYSLIMKSNKLERLSLASLFSSQGQEPLL